MMVDKVNKTLNALLKAFESCLKPDTPIPKKLQEYPNPLQEKLDLIKNQILTKDIQKKFEGPSPKFHTKAYGNSAKSRDNFGRVRGKKYETT